MGVFSWLHYLTYAKKTKLVDFHYKSLKSWKINNSDLTQQFKLSIFTNFYRLTAAGVNNSLQVLQGALVAGREKKREFATTSLEFEYLHQKNWSKLLIGEDDISYIVNTLGSCFHMFFHCLFTFALISASHWLKEILQLSRVGELAWNLRNHNHKTTGMTGITWATRMTGTIWMTRMTCRIRMNRMTINEMTWMAGISKMSGMTRTTGVTRMMRSLVWLR